MTDPVPASRAINREDVALIRARHSEHGSDKSRVECPTCTVLIELDRVTFKRDQYEQALYQAGVPQKDGEPDLPGIPECLVTLKASNTYLLGDRAHLLASLQASQAAHAQTTRTLQAICEDAMGRECARECNAEMHADTCDVYSVRQRVINLEAERGHLLARVARVEAIVEAARRHCELLRAIPYDEFAAEQACAEVEAALTNDAPGPVA